MEERRAKVQELAEKIEKMLDENHIHCEVYVEPPLPVVCVQINWGDWKHEHLRADLLVKEKFSPIFVTERLTEEDGSDCYSAVHKYLF